MKGTIVTIIFVLSALGNSNQTSSTTESPYHAPLENDHDCNCTCPNPVMEDLGNIATGAAIATAVSLPVGMVTGGGAVYLTKTCVSKLSLKNIKLSEVSPLENLPSLELDHSDDAEDSEDDDEKAENKGTESKEPKQSRTAEAFDSGFTHRETTSLPTVTI